MKRAWIVGAILSLMSVAAGFGQSAPSDAPPSAEALAAIFNQPSGVGCPQPQKSLDLPGQHSGVSLACSATATCNDTSHVNVSCMFSGTGGSCTFSDQNCAAGITGQVNCNGAVTSCPACPSTCGRPVCCTCESTGDCFACCRCDGGTIGQCLNACGGI